MSPDERKAFRRKIGQAVLDIQNAEIAAGKTPQDVLPEIIAALLSLATNIAHNNVKMSLSNLKQAFRLAAAEEWRL